MQKHRLKKIVPRVGIEPTLLAEPDFESGASTNSATEAFQNFKINRRILNPARLPIPPLEQLIGPDNYRDANL